MVVFLDCAQFAPLTTCSDDNHQLQVSWYAIFETDSPLGQFMQSPRQSNTIIAVCHARTTKLFIRYAVG